MILDQKSRKQLWVTSKTKKSFLWIGFLLGLGMALLVGFIGEALFGQQISNWSVYIQESYRMDTMQNQSYLLVFTLSASISMIFSPLGEEVFFRGFVHQGLRMRFSQRFATILDSTAFALIHLCHFGIIYQLGHWKFLPVPSFLWVLLMFLPAMLFSFSRNKSNSLWGAILSHAGFNLGMTTYIFFLI
jgi:membrane protease YdiL (CAAX protease family)